MINTNELIRSLCDIMSVTGFEHRAKDEITALCSPYFDEFYEAVGGSYVGIKRCGRENAPRLLIDGHFDEIGMMVTDILEGGYLSFTRMGGIDRRVLCASEVTIFGKKEIYGVICSKPPHLQKPGEFKKLQPLDEMLIDTGYSKEELEKIVSIGDAIGFDSSTENLLGTRICGAGLDDKVCCAAAIIAAANTPKEKMVCDLYVTLSPREEEAISGSAMAAYDIKPDLCIVTDVTFAKFPGIEDWECGKLGEGSVISLSAVTDRRLTYRIIELCEKNNVKLQKTVDAAGTGTNATAITLTGDGIPSAVVSVPLSAMHTYNEIIDTLDVENAAEIFSLVMCDREVFR